MLEAIAKYWFLGMGILFLVLMSIGLILTVAHVYGEFFKDLFGKKKKGEE